MTHYLKVTLKLILVVCFFNLAEILADEGAKTFCPDAILAVVGDRLITKGEVQQKMLPYIRQIHKEAISQEDFESKIASFEQEVLESMIDDIVMVNEFKANKKLQIPSALLDNNYTKFVMEQCQGNRSIFLQYLEQKGITDKQLREQQKEQMIIGYQRNLLRKSEAEISPMAINKYYNENKHLFRQEDSVHLRQIVLKGLEDDLSGSKLHLEKAQEVVKKLKGGQDFAQVAKEFSEDDKKGSGGDWGWINRSDIRPELADVAFLLPKGKFSDIVILGNYAFILFVEDKKHAGYTPEEEVRDYINKILASDQAKKAEVQHIQKLRKKTFIKYYI